ncbi:putative DNA helicase ino80 [Serendipita sp. 407]|nr:putative DNA helicase ino80 [Serendipita sp. 407]
MSLRALLNDEPQNPISALPPRSSSTSVAPPSHIVNVPSPSIPNAHVSSQSVPFPSSIEASPSVRSPVEYSKSSLTTYGHTNGSAELPPPTKTPSRKVRKSGASSASAYPNGHAMDVDSGINGDTPPERTGSTGRSNLTGRTSPGFTRPRAYSSDLEECPQVWEAAAGKYVLRTRTKMKDIERIFKEHNQQTNATLAQNLKSQAAARLLKIQARQTAASQAHLKASSRPYATLYVGSDHSRAGSEAGDGYGSEEDELRGDDLMEGVRGTLGVPGKREWDGSAAPSADEGDSVVGAKRDGRRRKAVMDPDEDDDSVFGEAGSGIGTPKRHSKKRKVDGALSTKASGLLVPKGTGAVGGKGARKGARKAGRGKELATGRISLKEWNVPYPELGPPPLNFGAPTSVSFSVTATSHGVVIPRISAADYDAQFTPVWASIVQEAVPYAHKARANHVAAVKIVNERLAKWCTAAAKRGWGGEYAPVSRKEGKEKDVGGRFGRDPVVKSRKLQRELLTFWKKNEKEEKEERRRREKERVEKARLELEKKEELRQKRKLEFLITQTELYSHFVGKRLKTAQLEAGAPDEGVGADPMLEQDDDAVDLEAEIDDGFAEGDESTLDFDKDDPERLQALARRRARQRMLEIRRRATDFDQARDQARREANAASALLGIKGGAASPSASNALEDAEKRMLENGGDQMRNDAFGGFESQMDIDGLDKQTGLKDFDELNFQNPTMLQNRDMIPQPQMLQATLKEYQLKGLNWLAGLYEQGINGILADEMGLGKTIQSIALLAHLAERQEIWGPFLVVSPASTLHNWQQELTRFVPTFKVIPYWGTVADRKTLRKFWAKKAIVYDRDAPFHIIVTSYNLIVTDAVYLKSLKWQYMILDEAQAIKSSSSARWNILLEFRCRNRLLLTGTPIQNSMQELWALLHFIMPSLFDSHDEFSEWFSKDIEGAAGSSGSGFNEHQLRRLHMILKPFMLRRVKRHVQNELGEKIEIDLYCELTPRQRYLYKALRANSSVAELLRQAANFATDAAATASLMNLVMQFRKVCNHPELFERADVQAPFSFASFGSTNNILREGDFVEAPYSTRNPILYSVPRMLYFDGGLLDVPSYDSDYGFKQRWMGCLMNIWTPDWMNRRAEKGFAFLKVLNQTPSEVNRTYKSSLIERMLASTQHQETLKAEGPYTSDLDLVARHSIKSEFLLLPRVSRLLERARDQPALHEISAYSWRETPLSRRQMQIYVNHAAAPPIDIECRSVMYMEKVAQVRDAPLENLALYGLPPWSRENQLKVTRLSKMLPYVPPGGLISSSPSVQLPSAQMHAPEPKRLIFDSGKLAMLDNLLGELKGKGHRCLIYFQMTRMIDLMEEYMIFRQYKYLRLDGDTRLEDRRDMVMDWQQRDDIFCFLLSTRAGGLGINLTAADTVIFYECDWNPSNDAQAMDRAHRLGQTRQVTVYRLITRGTIDQRIVQMAGVKKEVQDVVVGNKPFVESHKPNEIVKLLLDDDELEALQARGDASSLSIPPSGHASGMVTPSGGRKAPIQVHGSWEAEDDGFFTGGRMQQQLQRDEDIEFGGAGMGVGATGSGMNTPGGFETGGELRGPRGGKIRVRGRGRGRGRPPGIPNGEGKSRSRGRGRGTGRGRGRGGTAAAVAAMVPDM